SEALLGKPAVKYWMHGEFLLVDNGKMSKSLGNTYTLSDLREKGFSPLAYRYFCLNAHYRNKLNFTWDAMKAAQISYDRFLEGALAHKNAGITTENKVEPEVVAAFKKDFKEAITDDLNIPKALGIAWNVIRYDTKSAELYDLLLSFDKVLGLDIAKTEEKVKKEKDNIYEELEPEIRKMVDERQEARKQKNWKVADEIRNKLKDMGIILIDTPQGVKVSKEN
ncbi:MAG: cysteine--tRNA ligase, partial [Clostridiaceae bacterium]|nr:cysteine--tRNA ligase [Clostridiaceae bacterium]